MRGNALYESGGLRLIDEQALFAEDAQVLVIGRVVVVDGFGGDDYG